jgi:hypothetical protein
MRLTPLFGGYHFAHAAVPGGDYWVTPAPTPTAAVQGAGQVRELFITPIVYFPEKIFNKELIL